MPTQSGSKSAFISYDVVQYALDSLHYSSSGQDVLSPLRYLAVVEMHLITANYPATSHARDIAVRHILVTFIQDEYNKKRHIQNLSRISSDDINLEKAHSYIREDVQDYNPELIAWSCLYFQYVTIDLNITSSVYSAVAGFNVRTFRRYRGHGVKRLTQGLINEEETARQTLKQRRLAALLPDPGAFFVNRQREFADIEHILDKKVVRHFQITGIRGVGKTRLVREVIRKVLENGELDNLIWISGATAVLDIQSELEDQLLPDESQLSLFEILHLKAVIVVLDNVDTLLQAELAHFNTLLKGLENATVFVISSRWFPIHTASLHLPLGELSENDTFSMVKYILEHQPGMINLPEIPFDHLWKSVGGNPLAINLILSSRLQVDVIASEVLQELYSKLYNTLSPQNRLQWMMMSLFETEWVSLDQLVAIWNQHMDISSIAMLVQRHLIESDGAQFQLSTSALEFIKHIYQTSSEGQSYIQILLNDLDEQIERDPASTLTLGSRILMLQWIGIEAPRIIQWISKLSDIGIRRRGERMRWRNILQYHCGQEYALNIWKIRYAICLRRFHEWEDSSAVLHEVIEIAGSEGDFKTQSVALIELAANYRLQGLYALASECIDRVERSVNTTDSKTLYQHIQIEKAQIAVDLHNGRWAMELLKELPDFGNFPEACLLMAEAMILSEEYVEAQQTLTRLLPRPEVSDDPALVSSVYNGLGRCFNLQDKREDAINYFSMALLLYEAAEDYFRIARVRSNLAVCLIKAKRYDEAHQLLKQAINIQQQLNDRVGLEISLHNIQSLRIAIVLGQGESRS